MAERIQVPPTLMGDPQRQITQIWNYLYSMSQVLNRNAENSGESGTNEQAQAQQTQELARISERLSAAEQKIRNLNNTTQNAYTDETDLNNVTEQGIYWLTIANMTNKPTQFTSDREYALSVMAEDNGDEVTQIIYSGANIYMRMKHNGSWNSWSRLQPAT